MSVCHTTGCLESTYTLAILICFCILLRAFIICTHHRAFISSESIVWNTVDEVVKFRYCLPFSSTHRMTRRLSNKIRSKIAVWQEALGSVRQTQRLFNRDFKFFLPELEIMFWLKTVAFSKMELLHIVSGMSVTT